MNKQIEKIAEAICGLRTSEGCFCDGGYCNHNCLAYEQATNLYNKGYRKASDVVEEIFAEIANIIRYHDELAGRDGSEYGELIVSDIGCALGELKKKYTEVQGDGT